MRNATSATSAKRNRLSLLLPLLALAAAARAEDPATNAPAALGSHDLASAKAAECAGFSACAAAGDVVVSFATPNGVQPNGVQPAGAKIEKADLVYRHESEYRFVNPFFREWIKRGF